MNENSGSARRCVRVWFGTRVIVSAVTETADAAGYEAAMRRRFAGCRVTNDIAAGTVAPGIAPATASAMVAPGLIARGVIPPDLIAGVPARGSR